MPPKKKQHKIKPKYVFKVVKPTATPYKPSTSAREDAVLNLIKQQQQQAALQQQQILASFVSQLGSLTKPKPSSNFITEQGNQVFYSPTGERIYEQVRGPFGDIASRYSEKPEAPFVTSIYSDKERKKREKYFKKHGEYPPAEEHFDPIPKKEKPSYIPVPVRPIGGGGASGSTTKHDIFSGTDGPPPLSLHRDEAQMRRLQERGAPFTPHEASLVFGFDLGTAAGKQELANLREGGLIE